MAGSVKVLISDIDLIAVGNNINNFPSIQNDFQLLLTEFQKQLNPFKVDFRLRPEGKNSPLVWDLETYKDYFNRRARVWEYQSLLKLQFVTGDKTLFNKFKKSLIKK